MKSVKSVSDLWEIYSIMLIIFINIIVVTCTSPGRITFNEIKSKKKTPEILF